MNNKLLVVFLGIILFFYNIWNPTVIFTDELLINDSARAMANGGSWIVPTIKGSPSFTKPPLVLWLIALMRTLYPHSFIAGRILMGLFGMGILYFTYKLSASRVSVWLLMCSLPMIYFTKTANIDVPSAFFSIAMVYFYSRRFPLLAGVCLGLGILTRSYFAFFPLILPLYEKNYSELRRILGVGLLLALPWHILAYTQEPVIFWRDYVSLVTRHFTIIPGDTASTLHYYLRLFILYPPLVFALFVKHAYWSWILLFLAVLTVSQTRHEWYVISIIPPLSILAGTYLAKHTHFLIRWSALSMLLFPAAMLFFLPLPESQTTRAVRLAETQMGPDETLYELHYPLIPLTSTYPVRRVIITSDPPIGSMLLFRSNRGDIGYRRVTRSLFVEPL
jgi:4-amino-4-deoxy-L-arabinose transferase-like glycosyltransferase